ncbi:hypothetical protein FKM82_030569, partial [Ascaphus truei]
MRFCAVRGLYFLFALIPGVDSEFKLTQAGDSRTAKAGEQVTFQCSVSGGRVEDYWMYWYKKETGGQVLWIYREGELYGPGFEATVVGNIYTSKNLCTLQIRRAVVTDSG